MIASNRLDKLGLTRALAPRIKQMVSPEQALREYVPGLSIDASGYTRCPFHQEKTASLRVYPNRVYCYGCHFLGDSTAIVSKLFGLSALQAIEKLNADFRLGLPVGRPVTLREGLELQDRAKAAEAKVLADKEAHEAYLRRFEAKLDLEQRLFYAGRFCASRMPAASRSGTSLAE
jgi:DNA primase